MNIRIKRRRNAADFIDGGDVLAMVARAIMNNAVEWVLKTNAYSRWSWRNWEDFFFPLRSEIENMFNE